jgi:hypothetical protein
MGMQMSASVLLDFDGVENRYVGRAKDIDGSQVVREGERMEGRTRPGQNFPRNWDGGGEWKYGPP